MSIPVAETVPYPFHNHIKGGSPLISIVLGLADRSLFSSTHKYCCRDNHPEYTFIRWTRISSNPSIIDHCRGDIITIKHCHEDIFAI